MTNWLVTSNERLADQALELTEKAYAAWSRAPHDHRADVLASIADGLDAAADDLVEVAMTETHLTEPRLRNELSRTTFQLRFFGDIIRSGEHLAACIDRADPQWGMGPRPDLRRVNEPLGPVLVFAASNFPFAFSVAGGDTASALAAGCSVVLKAHPGHPLLSVRTGQVVAQAIRGSGGPDGLVTVIAGVEAGRRALLDRRIKAASFTGSIPGGRALYDLANTRPDPIPFYGELGSVNPTFVTESAARNRPDEIVRGFIDSFTLGAGQFCTKPGALFVPASGDLVTRLAEATYPNAAPLLNDRIQSAYVDRLTQLAADGAVRPLVIGPHSHDDPPTPTLIRTTVDAVVAETDVLVSEVFGPSALVVEYDDERRLPEVAAALEGQLTATIQGSDDDEVAPELTRILAARAGRVLWNQWPTGVTVSYAQQHGGPYPATTAPTSTSVGAAALQRFLRPVAYQGFPDHLLPSALQNDNPLRISRRVDG